MDRMVKSRAGVWEKIQVPRPTVIKAYNKCMGGTDKFDQFNSYYDQRLCINGWCESNLETEEQEQGQDDVEHPENVDNSHHKIEWWDKRPSLRLNGNHFPMQTDEIVSDKDSRQRCRLCNIRTVFKCMTCKVSLCIKKSCFYNWHTMEKLR